MSSSSEAELSSDSSDEWQPSTSKAYQRNWQRKQQRTRTGEENAERRQKDKEIRRRLRAKETAAARERRLGQKRQYDSQHAAKSATHDALNIIEADEFTVGDMTDSCKHCTAEFFEGEWVGDNATGVFNFCCLKGNLQIDDPFEGFPPNLIQLFERNAHGILTQNFHDCIRKFNSALAVGSMKAKTVDFKTHGPYCYKIHGQVYHTVNLALHPEEMETPAYAQLFIVDTAEATQHRMSFPPNADCNAELMAQLDALLRASSPYYDAFLMMKEVEEEEAAKAKQLGHEPPELRLLFDLKKDDQRRFNLPRSNEVASVFVVDENGELPPYDGIMVHQRGRQLHQLLKFDKRCDSMIYPLFFPTGKGGWDLGMKTLRGKKVTMAQYYRYIISRRQEPYFSPIHYGGKLFQQFLVDMYVKVEQDRLDFIRKNQKQLKVESYKGLTDYLKDSPDGNATQVGKDFILPSSFTGSPRNYQQRYQDAMAIVRRYGKPCLFLTMTANSNWPEIKRRLKSGQSASDAPDLVCRVFRLKVKQLLLEIKNRGRGVFGQCIAHSYSIEFQKRGTPHCHMLLILASDSKIKDATKIDQYVSAEIPDKAHYPRLHSLVEQFMIHGPCGALDPTCGCMEEGKCRFKYPKQFSEASTFGTDSYANYRRSDNGDAVYKKGIAMDNRWVAPYNPYLLTRFNCHLNVEICASVKSVKYLYKYVYKGWDAVTVSIEPNGQEKVERDEIRKFVDMRYVTPHEAFWRLAEYELYGMSHTIRRLAVHLPDEQVLCFDEEDNLQDVVSAAEKRHSTLTAYFELNKTDQNARELLYHEVPEKYTFKAVQTTSAGEVQRNMKWTPRGQGAKPCIGRMYTVSPKDEQSFYLRILLLHRKGATSFEDIRTVNGVTYEKFKDAAKALGLIGTDNELENCLREACDFRMPRELRQLFVTILLFCEPKEPKALWSKFKEHLSEDYARRYDEKLARQMAKLAMEQVLNTEGSSLARFGIKVPEGSAEDLEEIWNKDEELKRGEAMKASMNKDQKKVLKKVFRKLERIERGERPKAAYYIDGCGGSGKTYVYRTLCHLLRGHGKKYMTMAYTGCAATLLPDGKTLHKCFDLPVPTHTDSLSRIKPNSKAAKEILATDVFILDEAPMCAKHMVEAVDKKLRQLTGNKDLPFGGKVFLLSGDMRQVTPVKRYATKTDLINLSLKRSYLFKELKILRLKKNMRTLPKEKEFAKFLLKLGNGELQKGEEADVKFPAHAFSKGDLIDEIFGDCIRSKSHRIMTQRAILCTTNDACKAINDQVLGMVEGEHTSYFSRDAVDRNDPKSPMAYPDEFLHTLEASGLPSHELQLKPNVPLMLLRNLNVSQGLTNGTRVLLRSAKQSVLVCEIVSGDKAGQMAFIPRISCTSTDGTFPFTLYREQFPVRLCYSSTINKAQGSTYEKVGLNLEEEVFCHGHTYTAASRVRSWDSLKIKVSDDKMATSSVKNLVWRDALLPNKSRPGKKCVFWIPADPNLELSDDEEAPAESSNSQQTISSDTDSASLHQQSSESADSEQTI